MQLPSETLRDALNDLSFSGIVYRNQKWFSETYVQRKEKPAERKIGTLMEVGKIYNFIYDAKFADELDFWDACPMSFCCGHVLTKAGNVNMLGLNLSFIPPRVRVKVLDRLVKIFNTSVIKPNIIKIEQERFHSLKQLPGEYDVLKKLLSGSGFEFAIRSYIYKRMYNEPQIITYEDWWKLCTFGSKFMQKENTRAIYYLYNRALQDDYKIGKKNPEVELPKTTIKAMKHYLKTRNTKKD